MNKKFLTTLILLTFCATPICWAGEIIVGMDGQASYANEQTTVNDDINAKNEGSQMDLNEVFKNAMLAYMNGINSFVALSQSEMDKQGKFKRTANITLIEKAPKTIKYKRYLNKISNNEKRGQSNLTKFSLIDGDYVLWNKNSRKGSLQYCGEYHEDGKLFGVIKMKRVGFFTLVFYEYRISSQNDAELTHVMIYNTNLNESFVYTAEGRLRYCQLKDTIYSVDLPITSNLKRIDFSKLDKNSLESMSSVAKGVVCFPFGVLMLVAMPFMFAGFALTHPEYRT